MEAFLKRQKEKQEKERAEAKQRQMLKAQQEAEAKKRAEMLRRGDETFCQISQVLERIPTEYMETKDSSDSKLHFESTCSVRTLSLGDGKSSFSEIFQKNVSLSLRNKILSR